MAEARGPNPDLLFYALSCMRLYLHSRPTVPQLTALCSSGGMFEQHEGQRIPTFVSIPYRLHISIYVMFLIP